MKDPTRGPYLLDLVLSNFVSGIRCQVVPGVRDDDHEGVVTTLKVAVPAKEPVRRQVYDFNRADWQQLKTALASVDWGPSLQEKSADDAALWLTTTVLDLVDASIPSKMIADKSYAHPWIDESCREALAQKHAARGTASYATERDACSETFRCAYQAFVQKTREELKTLGPGSRGWWKTANSLLTKSGARENIPALQRPDGSWAMTPKERANELATTFQKKSTLPRPSTTGEGIIPHPTPCAAFW